MEELAHDFLAETEALCELLAPLSDGAYARSTGFKGYTIAWVINHLHGGNVAANLSLVDPPAFEDIKAGRTKMTMMDEPGEGDLNGAALLEEYVSFAREMAQSWEVADPRARLKWFGPDMSVRSSMTARLMETWSHAQAVYDILGVERINGNQIRNVAHIGWTTFGFCFGINKLAVPPTPPMLRLTAPSGADDAGEVWEWGDDDSAGSIVGSCEEFCQVVTQTRNIQDVNLVVTGDAAEAWMAIAQCFAGPPNPPPERGTRFRASDNDPLLVAKL